MQFLENNERLFILTQRWEPKQRVSYSLSPNGRKYKNYIQVRGKSLGVCIDEVFIKLSDNYNNIEWINKMKIEKAKYLHISEASNYGYIEGYFIDIDTNKESKYREYLWRNTMEKIEIIKDFVGIARFTVGGFGDSSSYEKPYSISPQNIEKLKSIGWSFNDIKPLSSQ
jgi:hypothetical protein